jgi:hypothetical protein
MLSLILGLILVGLGAWYFYGQPRDDVLQLIDYVDSYLDRTSVGKDDGGLPITESDTSPAATENTESANVLPTIATRPAAEIDTRASLTDGGLTGEDTASDEVEVNVAEEATTESADEQVVIAETALPQFGDDATTDLTGDTGIDGSQQSDPQFTLKQSFVHVSEGDGSARISNPLSANTVGQIFWWTADETAVAESDYIPVEEPRAGFSSGEESETLHVPLVNDSIPEPRETFYVYLGLHNPELGRLETIARISVEIEDDDLR